VLFPSNRASVTEIQGLGDDVQSKDVVPVEAAPSNQIGMTEYT
jgi:hypothetical protein